MFTIEKLLKKSTEHLICSSTPRLDAEVLLAHVLKTTRSYLYTYPNEILSNQDLEIFENLIARRIQREPVAYLTGHQEFWSLDLCITKDTLIPRSDSELLVETTLNLLPASENLHIADPGTGSGAIALALAKERPKWHIIGTDYQPPILEVAKKNADRLSLKNVNFFLSDWCTALPQYHFDAIISNPPYLTQEEFHQSNVKFEPREALVAGIDGLEVLQKIIDQVPLYLKSNGLLLLEHGYTQGVEVRKKLSEHHYDHVKTIKDLADLERVTYGFFKNANRI